MENANLARTILMTAWNAQTVPSALSAVKSILWLMTRALASAEEVASLSSTRLQNGISVFVKPTSYLRPRDAWHAMKLYLCAINVRKQLKLPKPCWETMLPTLATMATTFNVAPVHLGTSWTVSTKKGILSLFVQSALWNFKTAWPVPMMDLSAILANQATLKMDLGPRWGVRHAAAI